MKAASERVPVTRRLLRFLTAWSRRARCAVSGHRMRTVTKRRAGVLYSVPLCERCLRVDYEGVTTRAWNRATRRAAAQRVARQIGR